MPFFTVLLPLLVSEAEKSNDGIGWSVMTTYIIHVSTVLGLLWNVMFNYILCVCTKHEGESFNNMVHEIADATSFQYPESPSEIETYRAQLERTLKERMCSLQEQRRSTSIPTAIDANGDAINLSHLPSSPPYYSWMLLGPMEWGFCLPTNQPKPARSHYDHVTRKLILNMDHFCPWMFNAVGYFNYRYFCNFLLFTFLAMCYGVSITYKPFQILGAFNTIRGAQLKENIKLSTSERNTIAFCFMLCLSIGIAVFCLLGFHFYLILTAQTTIEFHGNFTKRRRARMNNTTWKNPYDLGPLTNFSQIYGTSQKRSFFMLVITAFLPSKNEPHFLPFPIKGDLLKRQQTFWRKRDIQEEELDIVINNV